MMLLAGMLLACSERREYTEALTRAKAVLDERPDSALGILDTLLTHESELSRGFRMRCRLYRMSALNKLYSPDFTATEVWPLVDYFEAHGTPNERMTAYYLLGRTYYIAHEAPMALNCYQKAAEQADTTAADCDYRQLCRVYGQISEVFYQQGLLHENIEFMNLAIRYAERGNDTIAALLGMADKVFAYEKLHKPDSAVALCEKASTLLHEYGYLQFSAGIRASIIQILVDAGEYAKAKENMDIYEAESGFFDADHNIEKGREIYYHTKGYYYAAIGKLDSAEYYFRKELRDGKDFGNQNSGARGLAQVFQKRHLPDSAAKYALYSYEMNDSVYDQMAMEEVERTRAMYDYTRHQEIAQQERDRAEAARTRLWAVAFVLLCVVFATTLLIRRERRKRGEERRDYEQRLSDLAKAQADVMRLRSHEAEQRQLLVLEKEERIARLTEQIEAYKARVGQQQESSEARLQASAVYGELKKQAARATVLSEEDWHRIYMMVIETLPNFYKLVSAKKLELNDNEFKTCILIRLHFTPKETANMLNVSAAYITKLRNDMMRKLFDVEGKAKDLDERLMQFS